MFDCKVSGTAHLKTRVWDGLVGIIGGYRAKSVEILDAAPIPYKSISWTFSLTSASMVAAKSILVSV